MSEKAKIWRIDELDNLELLSAQYVDQMFPWHTHESYCIGIIQKGAEFLEFRNKKFLAPAGSIITINPKDAHKNYAASQKGWVHRMFYVSEDVLKSASRDNSISLISFKNAVQRNDEIFTNLKKVHSFLEKNPFNKEFEDFFIATLHKLVHRFASEDPRHLSPGTEDISIIAQYLREHIDQDITIETLSNRFGLSPYYLIRKFKKNIGLTPHSYLVQARISKAKQLLEQARPIVQIALDTGFYDQSHFTKSFQRYVGVSPYQFMKQRNFLQ